MNKRNIIFLALIFVIIIGAVVGYIFWRINEDKRLSEEGSEAANDPCYTICGNNNGGCCVGDVRRFPAQDNMTCLTGNTWCDNTKIYHCEGGNPVSNLNCADTGKSCNQKDNATAECVVTPSGCSVQGSCSWTGCSLKCKKDNVSVSCRDVCGNWGPSHFVCGPCNTTTNKCWTRLGCSDKDADFKSKRDNIDYAQWCTVQQGDSQSGGDEYVTAWIGDKGERCYKGFTPPEFGLTCQNFVGCPNGATSCDRNSDGKIDQADLDWDCANVVTELSFSGRVYCQDAGGPVYPVSAELDILRNSLGNTTATTGADGSFSGSLTGETGQFAVRLKPLSSTGKLSNNQPYSAMKGPSLNNAVTQCTRGTSYESCNPKTTPTNPNMNFVFTNCSPGVETLRCGDTCTTVDQACTADNTVCKSTPLGNRCVNPTNYTSGTITQDYFTRGCSWPIPVNPEWSISKRSNGYCIDQDTDNPKYKADYSIVVSNAGTVEATLERVVDRPEGVRYEWLVSGSISPSSGVASQASGLIDSITWTLTGSDKTFAVGSSKTYSYSIIIPKGSFNKNYRNRATGYPSSGSEFSADSNIWASCKLPPTGIFDSVMSKVLVGTLLMLLGGIYLYSFNASEKTVLLYNGLFGKEAINHRRQVSNKKKVAAKRERFKMKQGN